MKQLSVPQLRLSGLQMIEASAGTGKTWTIAALYLRLLLEHALPVEKILVVTFTNAATAELKERIRQRLIDAHAAFTNGDAGQDEVIRHFFAQNMDREKARALLTLALESFDLAAIHTIHGFCQRALAERAFESGLPFDSELSSDDRRMLHEMMEDVWRRFVINDGDPLWLAWLLARLPGPEALLRQLRSHFGKPYLHLLPAEPVDESATPNFIAAFAEVQRLWHAEGKSAVKLLCAHPGMNQQSHSAARIEKLAELLARWLDGGPSLTLPENLARLAASGLKVNKGHAPPEHTLCDALDILLAAAAAAQSAFEARLGHLWLRALLECEAGVRAARQQLAQRSFDDLLLDLHAALLGEGGATLAASLRQRYAAALIDEFQDTDPLQYGIFSRIFFPDPASANGEEPPIYFVGDPKQAIYSFRGADLQTYLDAKAAAGEPLLLNVNRRSTAALIASVNAIFWRNARPFLFEEPDFKPVQAPDNAPRPIELDGKPLAAMSLWLMPREGKELEPRKSGPNKGKLGLIPKNRAGQGISDAVAASIAELMQASHAGRVTLDDKGKQRRLEGQDIAILVKTHYQGEQMRAALQAAGVKSVRYGQDSVFASQEASEIERVLLAIALPVRDGLVRSALATRLMGVRGDELAAIDGDAWLARLDDFYRWHVLARDHGFIRMWRTWQLEARVPQRLLALPDGERAMTNLLHLSDLLATLAHDEKLGIEALAKYLADARNDEYGEARNAAGEAQLLRLESDENLVRIVTIHAAKGLEYPLTYCPFLWDGGLRDDAGPVRYHEPERNYRAALDFGSAALEDHRELALREARAEALRLTYVALTRARQRCVLVWGAFKDANASPLAWLLHGEEDLELEGLDDTALLSHLNKWQAACPQIEVRTLATDTDAVFTPAAAKAGALRARPWPQRALLSWRMHSFSAWLADPAEHRSDDDELPDYDAPWGSPSVTLALPAVEEIATPEVSTFPAGANAGTCLHAIFEQVSFTTPEDDVIADVLVEFGFAASLHPVAKNLVGDTLHTPMSTGLPPLADIPRRQQIREMEFLLPVSAPDMAALANAVGEQAGADGKLDQRIFALNPAQLAGFLKGFIDLVFMHEDRWYVLDYKSNHLGPALHDYGEPQLAEAMAEAMYDLQALLYCVALHLALQQRLPDYDYERHCGGSLYLFLRGMRPGAAGSGVFAWRPDEGMVARVAACLAAKRKVLTAC